ncbi:hypothetical protein BaRGS_00018578, partial [Batillaria attramentaria]
GTAWARPCGVAPFVLRTELVRTGNRCVLAIEQWSRVSEAYGVKWSKAVRYTSHLLHTQRLSVTNLSAVAATVAPTDIMTITDPEVAVASRARPLSSPCQSISTQYVWNNLANLSRGTSNVQQLENLALRPILHPRVPSTAGNRRAREHIKTFMTTVGWTVEEDSFYDYTPYGRLPFSNVIATLDPRKSRRMVFACHYDSKLMHSQRFVGATDSAVPCAILMDTALRLVQFFTDAQESTSDLTIQFVFFDGEEAFRSWTDQDSLYGSRHLADKWSRKTDPNFPGRKMDSQLKRTNRFAGSSSCFFVFFNDIQEAFVLLDLIGTPDTFFKRRFTETAPVYNKLQQIESCLRERGLLNPTRYQHNLFSDMTDTVVIQDDHIPFLRRGVPVVHLITWPYPSVWHTSNDNLDSLEMPLIDNLARILRVFMADLPL